MFFTLFLHFGKVQFLLKSKKTSLNRKFTYTVAISDNILVIYVLTQLKNEFLLSKMNHITSIRSCFIISIQFPNGILNFRSLCAYLIWFNFSCLFFSFQLPQWCVLSYFCAWLLKFFQQVSPQNPKPVEHFAVATLHIVVVNQTLKVVVIVVLVDVLEVNLSTYLSTLGLHWLGTIYWGAQVSLKLS